MLLAVGRAREKREFDAAAAVGSGPTTFQDHRSWDEFSAHNFGGLSSRRQLWLIICKAGLVAFELVAWTSFPDLLFWLIIAKLAIS